MEWWWLPLMLVMAPWLRGNPGTQPRGPGLWHWLALLFWLPGVHPCLFCFFRPVQQRRFCQDVTGAPVNDPRHRQCLKALDQAAAPLVSVTVGPEQRKALQEIIMDAVRFLEKEKGKKSLEVSLQEAVNMIWVKLSQLEEALACIPPCGYQPNATFFQCSTCRLMECQLPLDCPVQEVRVHADEPITLLCDVPFAIPPNLPVSWMFAKDVYTQDLAMFEEVQVGVDGLFAVTVQDPAPGTVSCHLGIPSAPLARKYFYLNVSEGSVEAEEGLQAHFGAVLHWPHGTTSAHHMPLLVVGLALGSMVLVLLLVRVLLTCAAHRCWRPPKDSDHQTSHRPGQQGPPGASGYLESP